MTQGDILSRLLQDTRIWIYLWQFLRPNKLFDSKFLHPLVPCLHVPDLFQVEFQVLIVVKTVVELGADAKGRV